MIIYLRMKYVSNTLIYSKDIAQKQFFVRTGQGDAICPPPPNIACVLKICIDFAYF